MGYNTSGYDIEFLKRFAARNDIDDTLFSYRTLNKNGNNLDIYSMLQKELFGYESMDPVTTAQVEELLTRYADLFDKYGTRGVREIRPGQNIVPYCRNIIYDLENICRDREMAILRAHDFDEFTDIADYDRATIDALKDNQDYYNKLIAYYQDIVDGYMVFDRDILNNKMLESMVFENFIDAAPGENYYEAMERAYERLWRLTSDENMSLEDFKVKLRADMGGADLTFNNYIKFLSGPNGRFYYRNLSSRAMMEIYDTDKLKYLGPATARENIKYQHAYKYFMGARDRKIQDYTAVVGPTGIYKNIDELRNGIELFIELAPDDSVVKMMSPKKLNNVVSLTALLETCAHYSDKASDWDDFFDKLVHTASSDAVDSDLYKFLPDETNTYQTLSSAVLGATSAVDAFDEIQKFFEGKLNGQQTALDMSNVRAVDSFITKSFTQKLKDAINTFRDLSSDYKIKVDNEIRQSESIIKYNQYQRFFNNIEVDQSGAITQNGIDYLLKHLIFDQPILPVDIGLADMDYNTALSKLLQNEEALTEAGIKSFVVSGTTTRVFYLSKDVKLSRIEYVGDDKVPTIILNNARSLINDLPKEELDIYPYIEGSDEISKQFIEIINETKKMIQLIDEDMAVNATGFPLNKSSYSNIYFKYGLDIPFDMRDANDLAAYGFFDKLHIADAYMGPIKEFTYANVERTFRNSVLESTLKQLEYVANTHNMAKKYEMFLFSGADGLNFSDTGLFARYMQTAEGMQELLEAIPDDYMVIYPEANHTKLGYNATRIDLNTVDDLIYARDRNAILVPYDVYSKVVDRVNNQPDAQYPVVRFARNFIYLYKLGYLTSLGTWKNNAIDSPIKMILEDESTPSSAIGHMVDAISNTRKFKDIYKAMMLEAGGKIPVMTDKSLKKFFVEHPEAPLTYNEFKSIKEWMDNGINTTDLKSILPVNTFRKELSKEYPNLMEEIPEQNEARENFLSRISDLLLKPMSAIEETVRYGQFLELQDMGYTKSEIYKKISHSQFDYADRTQLERIMEIAIPFYSFGKKNAMFWADMVERYPIVLDTFVNYMNCADNIAEDYSDEEAAHFNPTSMNYYTGTGAIPLNENGLMLKMNFSILDAFNFITQPINYFQSSLFSVWDTGISAAKTELQIKNGTYPIPLGKLKGQPMSDLLKKENWAYAQQLVNNPMLQNTQAGKIVYNYLISNNIESKVLVPFGKYKNMRAAQLIKEHPEYAQWLLTQDLTENFQIFYDYLWMHGVNNNPLMPFGKYQGQPISAVPAEYKTWLSTQDWFTTNYDYLVDIIANNRNTVVEQHYQERSPLQRVADLDTTGLLKDQLPGLESALASTVFQDDSVKFSEILTRFLMNTDVYPLLGTAKQRVQMSNKLKERTEYMPDWKRQFVSAFPTIFGAISRYDTYQRDRKYLNTETVPETYQIRSLSYPEHNYNYYRYDYRNSFGNSLDLPKGRAKIYYSKPLNNYRGKMKKLNISRNYAPHMYNFSR